MKRFTRWIPLAVLSLLMFLSFVGTLAVSRTPAPALAQTDGQCVELYIGGELVFQSETCVAEPTATVTFTPTPDTTATPAEKVMPYREGPACEPGAHDLNQYHELWDYQRGCHYDHGHGANPATTAFAGRDSARLISGAWSTPGENAPAPDGKHKGFYNVVADGPASGVAQVMVQVHDLASNRALKARFHTAHVFVAYENGAFASVATVLDFGLMHQKYKDTWQQTIHDEPGVSFHLNPPYRASAFGAGAPRGGRNIHYWNMEKPQPVIADMYPDPYGFTVGSLDFLTGDAWSRTPLGDACYLMGCYPDEDFIGGPFNGSLKRLYNVSIDFPTTQPGTHFTDRHGRLDDTCMAPSFDCLPLVIEGAVSDLSFDNGAGFPTWQFDDPANEWIDDDICFNSAGAVAPCYETGAVSSGWITYQ